MVKKTRMETAKSKRRITNNPIETGLRCLEEEARGSGYQLAAHLIGVAALAARDESPRRSSSTSG